MDRRHHQQIDTVANVLFRLSAQSFDESPDGSIATAGIGCHSMAIWLEDRATQSFTQMGGEGLHWVGQAPFTDRQHMFQNLGDGTYYHSGFLAIRAAISAGVNITYKLLYNDAVAMTGGQPVEGCLLVPDITRELHAEGVRVITVVSDEPRKYPTDAGFAPGSNLPSPRRNGRVAAALARHTRR